MRKRVITLIVSAVILCVISRVVFNFSENWGLCVYVWSGAAVAKLDSYLKDCQTVYEMYTDRKD